MSECILELKGITKKFGGVKALDNVCFSLKKGEIHALMGENGAGKSTFIKIITGVHQADSGDIYYNNEKVVFKSPRESMLNGIAAIYQHVTSYPHLSVTENIFIGHEKVSSRIKRILWNKMHNEAQDLLNQLGADFTSQTIVGTLSVAQKQMVEIAKALSLNAKIIIMDEPTAALTKKESEELYKITEGLRDKGVSVIFISHRFEDMYRLATQVTVFRDSKYINSWKIKEIKNDNLVEAMVGRKINQLFPKKNENIGDVVLSAKKLSRVGYFADISFDVRAGEILSFTGLIGAGRTEVFESLLGIAQLSSGEIYVNGNKVTIKHPSDAMNLGLGYLPEDRQIQGLILDWTIEANISLSNIGGISHYGWLDISKEHDVAQVLSEKIGIKALSVSDRVSSLSGGNQQKVVISKLLTKNLKLLILDEPTKGVDVGAKSAIYQLMNELASQGYAIIMISSEMPEVLGMSNRIIVMKDGRITESFDNVNVSQEMILKAAMYTQEISGGDVLAHV